MDVSVLDVAKEKLKKVGLGDSDVGTNTVSDYPQREFIVQYQEDDTNFIGRLTEHAGVAFYFDHSQGHDRVVFVDLDREISGRNELFRDVGHMKLDGIRLKAERIGAAILAHWRAR